jgi:hypothetical protein
VCGAAPPRSRLRGRHRRRVRRPRAGGSRPRGRVRARGPRELPRPLDAVRAVRGVPAGDRVRAALPDPRGRRPRRDPERAHGSHGLPSSGGHDRRLGHHGAGARRCERPDRAVKDPELAERLAERGRRTISERFDAATTAARMASLLTATGGPR